MNGSEERDRTLNCIPRKNLLVHLSGRMGENVIADSVLNHLTTGYVCFIGHKNKINSTVGFVTNTGWFGNQLGQTKSFM